MLRENDEAFKICNVLGGLDVARYVSSNARNIFQEAIEDIELIREYVGQAALNEGIVGGFSDLDDMNHSLDWEGRSVSQGSTTVDAGLGFVDDRSERTLERYVAFDTQQPLVGNKQNDVKIIDTLSNLFPWIIDRRSIEKMWYSPHQNGRSEGAEKESFLFDTLYSAAWIGTYGNAWLYYPPLISFSNGHPLTVADEGGELYITKAKALTQSNSPQNNPSRHVFLTNPYSDLSRSSNSLITALGPIYFSGNFNNFTYNETFIGSTGLDINLEAISSIVDVLYDRMTVFSFALIVDIDFNTIVMSPRIVRRLFSSKKNYPDIQQSPIPEEGGNLTDDSINQNLLQLDDVIWQDILQEVKKLERGGRGFSIINLKIPENPQSEEYYVMFERWAFVADWVMLSFAQKNDLEHAIDINILNPSSSQNETTITLLGEWGHDLFSEVILCNNGTLDVLVTQKRLPIWLQMNPTNLEKEPIPSGGVILLQLSVDTTKLDVGMSSFSLTFTIEHDDYPDCFYNHDISIALLVKVLPRNCALIMGDAMRVADAHGNCVCSPTSIEIWNRCVKYTVLLPSFFLPLLLLGFTAARLYITYKSRQSDYIWLNKATDLIFDESPEILGRGTFGLVVRAEYRGTQVAVKRVIPPLSKDSERDATATSLSFFETLYPLRRQGKERRSSMTKIYFDFDGAKSGDRPRRRTSLCGSTDSLIGSKDTSRISEVGTQCNNKLLYIQLKEEFVTEMRLLSRLRHPCITTVMGAVLESGEEPLLVMELMDHGSLFDLLHNDSMVIEGDIVLPILRDIAQGLRFLHAASPEIIHGDLKALNVLVDHKFRAKVADFGLSQKKGSGVAGTPYWMAPELLRDEARNTTASDVYSFGIVLFEVYSREIPYQGETFDDVIRDIRDPNVRKRPGIPASMPSQIIDLMNACIDESPTVRSSFQDIDFRMKLFTVANVEPTQIYQSIQKKKLWDGNLTAAETVLLDMFPKHVAKSLSQGHKVKPEHFNPVTIFFSDIVGLTQISSEMSPLQVSDMLDRLYIKFDHLSRKHNVLKIETIGDAWMGVTNVANPQTDHTRRIAAFALDAIEAANSTLIDPNDISRGHVRIRVGIHSGPVIGTLVGSRNPKYTLIGDIVNISSKMESNSQPGRILCSEAALKHLQQQAPECIIQSAGLIDVKGTGLMEAFWINGILQDGNSENESVLETSPLLSHEEATSMYQSSVL
jgi:serine/threonine protein kinase